MSTSPVGGDTATSVGGPGRQLPHAIRSRGALLIDEWCGFLGRHRELLGGSIDYPPDVHDRYRVDEPGGPSSDRLKRGPARLRTLHVDVNGLSGVHRVDPDRSTDVHRYVRDELRLTCLQHIPVVERERETGTRGATPSSSGPTRMSGGWPSSVPTRPSLGGAACLPHCAISGRRPAAHAVTRCGPNVAAANSGSRATANSPASDASWRLTQA